MTRQGPSELGVVMRPGSLIRRPARKAVDADLASESREPSPVRAIETHIFIKGLQVDAEIGVYAHEMGKLRPLILDIDVTLSPDIAKPADDLTQTVDYDGLVSHVQAVTRLGHLQLIETFAEEVCTRILTDPRITQVRLRVEKPGSVAQAVCSGVEFVRVRA